MNPSLVQHGTFSEVEAILKPIYEKFEEYCKNMDVNGSLKYYHSQAVVVEKGKQAFYGKERKLFPQKRYLSRPPCIPAVEKLN